MADDAVEKGLVPEVLSPKMVGGVHVNYGVRAKERGKKRT